jgi:sulfite exporter TauE/SafE
MLKMLEAVKLQTGFFVLLGAGLLTGLSHCVGMCGPLVGAFSMRQQAAGQEVSTPLVLYQTGRLTTYMLLGAIVGSIGAVFATFIHAWQGIFSVALGLSAVLLGLGLLGLFPVQGWLTTVVPLQQVGQWIRNSMTSPHPAAPFALGLANGLLPCGPVYTMILLAALSGNPLQGASLMLIFGLGTLPVMLGLGLSSMFLSHRLRSHLYRVAALLVVAVGLQLTLRGLALHGQIPHTALAGIMLW